MTLTLEQAATYLQLHPHTVQARARAGIIPGSKPGRRWTFTVEELDSYKRSLAGEPTVEDLVQGALVTLHQGPAIYFLLVGKEIVYVGKTRNLTRRLGDHAFRKKFDGFSYLPCREADLDRFERILIAKFTPRLNVRVPWRP